MMTIVDGMAWTANIIGAGLLGKLIWACWGDMISGAYAKDVGQGRLERVFGLVLVLWLSGLELALLWRIVKGG